MQNREVLDRLARLKESAAEQLAEITQLEGELVTLMEENHNLAMENKHLKDRLDSLQEPAEQIITEGQAIESSMSKSLLNLENIYHEGFHICNLYYGKRRENDEECMFCTDILYGE